VLCAADYTSTASRVVVAWKDRGRLDLTPVLVRGLAVSVAGALAVLGDPAPIQLVPVASTASAVRRRQDDVVARLARGAADLVRAGPGPPRVRVTPVLALRRGVADAAGLAAHERRRNLDGRVRLRAGSAALVHGHGVLLVDDVVTTGASAATSAEVLEAAGARVPGVCVVCATPRRARARPGLSGPFEVV
jgi:predicted amidophosphoribosyltransferase